MNINPTYEITFKGYEIYFSAKFYFRKDLFKIRYESNDGEFYTYYINNIVHTSHVWEGLIGEVSVENFDFVKSNLIEFWKTNRLNVDKKLQFETETTFNFFIDKDSFRFGSLQFKSDGNQNVGFDNHLQKVNLDSNSVQEAYSIIFNKINDTLRIKDTWKLTTQNVVLFDEFIEVSPDKCTYFGFVDHLPYVQPTILFELPTSDLLLIIELFINFLKINGIEK